jgi:hypothetical protein
VNVDLDGEKKIDEVRPCFDRFAFHQNPKERDITLFDGQVLLWMGSNRTKKAKRRCLDNGEAGA